MLAPYKPTSSSDVNPHVIFLELHLLWENANAGKNDPIGITSNTAKMKMTVVKVRIARPNRNSRY